MISPRLSFYEPDAAGKLAPHQIEELKKSARYIRGKIIELSCKAGTPHIASALSPVDLLVAAYGTCLRIDPAKPLEPSRDISIFSKGHAALALYCTLCARGFFPDDVLNRFAEHGAPLAEQPAPRCAPGVELATGSLGHGLPVGAGFVLSQRIQKWKRHVFVLLGDGECNEGSNWETALFAAGQKMSELTIAIDFNKWQATGRSREVMQLDDFRGKWESFGWRAIEVDGHNMEELVRLFHEPPDPQGRPTAFIAHTTKGKGVSFMEDNNNWHYLSAKPDHLAKALQELEIAL